MKNKKLTLIASIMLVAAILCGSVSAAAVDYGDYTTAPTMGPTTAPADQTTTMPTTNQSTVTTVPTTDNNYESDEAYNEGYWDGYEDGWDDAKEEYEGEDYDSGYDEGWDDGYDSGEWDGYYDGYDDGYYEGYYDAVQDMENKDVITIFDRWDAFIEDLRERIDMFIYRIRAFFEKIFNIGSDDDYDDDDYDEPTINPPSDLTDTSFIPDGSQATLKDDADAQALCDEFNELVNDFCDAVPDDVHITQTWEIDATMKDLPSVVASIVNPILENFTGTDVGEEDFEKGESTYGIPRSYLDPAGLTQATKTVNEDGTTDYKFVLIEEASFYNGYETKGVKLVDGEVVEYTLYHVDVNDIVYIEYVDLGPVTIDWAQILYPGATVTAKTDAQGRLIKYDMYMPVDGTATGKAGPIRATVSAEGNSYICYVMDYDA